MPGKKKKNTGGSMGYTGALNFNSAAKKAAKGALKIDAMQAKNPNISAAERRYKKGTVASNLEILRKSL